MYSHEDPTAPDIPGETKPRVAGTNRAGETLTVTDGARNMHDNFLQGMAIAGSDAPCLGYRPLDASGVPGPYEWLSYGQVGERATDIGSGLARLGVGAGARIGIYSPNRIEWSLVEHACYMYGLVLVPMYDTLGIEAVAYMTEEAEICAVVVAPEKVAELGAMWPRLPLVKTVIVLGPVPDSARAAALQGGTALTLDELIGLGRDGGPAPRPKVPAGLTDMCSICYTSGTTARPKGVVITHMGFLSATRAAHELVRAGQLPDLGPDDVHLSILPLAHCLERAVHTVMTGRGVRIGFTQGDPRRIIDDIGELRPTILVAVPRILNRIHDLVWAQVNAKGGMAALLFGYAYRVKRDGLRANVNRHWLWDRVVFGAVRNKLGGRVRLIVSGSAPISADVLDFLRITLSATVLEGYGLTETAGPCSISWADDNVPGSIGPPISTCKVKLVSVPEMGYTVDDKPHPRGELHVKGACVFSHYYKRPDLTSEVVDADGWFATGDIGVLDERGTLALVDRKKNIFKLAQGEYIAPERIEVTLTDSPLIDQVYVHGDSLQRALVAVVVPNGEELAREIASRPALAHLANAPFATLCSTDAVVALVLAAMDAWARGHGLRGFEIPKAIFLEAEPFSVANGILTPTLKVKRPAAKARYAQTLADLYTSLAQKGGE